MKLSMKNDRGLGGRKGRTVGSIEKTPAVKAIGDTNNLEGIVNQCLLLPDGVDIAYNHYSGKGFVFLRQLSLSVTLYHHLVLERYLKLVVQANRQHMIRFRNWVDGAQLTSRAKSSHRLATSSSVSLSSCSTPNDREMSAKERRAFSDS